MSTLTFPEVVKEHFSLLSQYTPVLVRVHGNDHPELAEVRDIFAAISTKVKEYGPEQVDLSTEFKELRRVTDNYSVPSDGCGTYMMTYEMLADADKAYHA